MHNMVKIINNISSFFGPAWTFLYSGGFAFVVLDFRWPVGMVQSPDWLTPSLRHHVLRHATYTRPLSHPYTQERRVYCAPVHTVELHVLLIVNVERLTICEAQASLVVLLRGQGCPGTNVPAIRSGPL